MGKIGDWWDYALLRHRRRPAPKRVSPPETGPDHAMYRYATGQDLLDVIERYVAEGDAAGQVTVMFATPDRVEAVRARLARSGLADCVEAHDAEAALGRFMVGGSPSAERFDEVVHEALAGRKADRVRLYGEMVDVLWQRGNVTGALELEQVWNDHLAEHPVSLLCAYDRAATEGHPELDAVCDAHRHVLTH